MALGIYSTPHPDAQFGALQPFTITFDGRIGGAQDRLVYIRNDDATRWYSSVTISAHDTEGFNLVDGSQAGFSWKLMSKDIPPTEEEWALVSPGNTVSFSGNLGSDTLGDIITFVPVWVRVEIPRGQAVSVFTDITLRVRATEALV